MVSCNEAGRTAVWGMGVLLALTACSLGCNGDSCPEGLESVGGRCVKAEHDAGVNEDPMNTGGMSGTGGSRSSRGTGGMDVTGGANTAESTGGADATVPIESTGGADATVPLDGAALDPCDGVSCGDHATCVADGVNAACECEVGYVEDGAGCERDECIPLPGDAATCGDHSQCLDPSSAVGDVQCTCDEGYVDNGAGCERNECVALPGGGAACGVNTTCDDPSAAAADFICACQDGFASCDGDADTTLGCETDLTNDADNCGECGYACAGTLACAASTCEQPAERLALGAVDTCALSNGENGAYDLECAGYNPLYQLRIAEDHRATMAALPGIGRVRDVSMSNYHTCVIPSAGDKVSCWGNNSYNQLGSADTSLTSDVVVNVTLSNVTFKEVSAGDIHTCARTTGGEVYCWGNYAKYRLGVAQPQGVTSTHVPQKVPGVSGAVQLGGGGSSTCALASNGVVRCWGALDTDTYFSPTVIANAQGSAIVADKVVTGGYMAPGAAGYDNASYCALLRTGEIACWGVTALGLVGGMTSLADSADTATLIGVLDAIDVALGFTGGCAVLQSGALYCWGFEQFQAPGTSGVKIVGPTYMAMPDGVDDVIDVEVGGLHACVRRRSGQVLCMGNDNKGQLADGAPAVDSTPEPWSAVLGYP